MKRLFIVETTTGYKWETNPGFHFVMAKNMDEAKDITSVEVPDEKISSVVDVAKEMKTKTFKTILTSNVE